MIRLPLSSEPAQSFITQLGSVKWLFNFRFNDRGRFWIMDITDSASQTILVTGVPVLLGCDLIRPYILGNGALMAYDEAGSSTDAGDPDTGDLGNRVNIYWISLDEVNALESPA